MSETSLLSPPPPFDKPPASLRRETDSLSKKLEAAERMEKQYGSEPCILDAVACRRHQAHPLTHSGRYRSADLSLKGLDKCSRLRARSFGQGSKSLPRTSYPLPVMKKSPPVKLAVVHPGSDTISYDISLSTHLGSHLGVWVNENTLLQMIMRQLTPLTVPRKVNILH